MSGLRLRMTQLLHYLLVCPRKNCSKAENERKTLQSKPGGDFFYFSKMRSGKWNISCIFFLRGLFHLEVEESIINYQSRPGISDAGDRTGAKLTSKYLQWKPKAKTDHFCSVEKVSFFLPPNICECRGFVRESLSLFLFLISPSNKATSLCVLLQPKLQIRLISHRCFRFSLCLNSHLL